MSLFAELKRRNVVRTGIAYVLIAWVVLQIIDFTLELTDAPSWVLQVFFITAAVGLPIVLILSWVYEITPEGIRREVDVERAESITPETSRKLDRLIIAALALVVVVLLAGRFMPADAPVGASSDRASEVAVAADPAGEIDPATARTTVDAPTHDARAIAVLPFVNRSANSDDLFFTDGIHDDLLTQLAKIGELKVISRTSVMAYRGTTKRIPEIADELGVGVVLEGGVQRAGDRVRINAQLINVATDEHLWAETFDRELTLDNIFDIQSEITGQIVTAIKGELSDSDRSTLTEHPTDNLEAWEAYLQARAVVSEPDYEAEKYERAEVFARSAVEADPNFAEAWADLASIILNRIWIGTDNTPEAREQARDYLDRALAINPDSARVKLVEAEYFYRVDVDYGRALALTEAARDLAPGEAQVYEHLGFTLRRLDRWDESVAAFEQSMALDPLNPHVATTLIETLMLMNDWDRILPLVELWLQRSPRSSFLIDVKAQTLVLGYGDVAGAETYLARTREAGRRPTVFTDAYTASLARDWDRMLAIHEDVDIDPGLAIQGVTPDYRLGLAYCTAGQEETGATYLKRFVEETDPEALTGIPAKAYMHINLATAHARLGNEAQARVMAERALALLGPEQDSLFGTQIERMSLWVYAWLGDRDYALDGIAARLDAPGGYPRWELYLDPNWDFFRDDPRFVALVRPDGVEAEPFRRMGDGT
ncbi:MAG: hypothetical protein AAGH19_07330 [Pseudomonadota bacterium]